MINELSNLIRDPKLEELELNLRSPNIFTILNIAQTEIRHSNFLAWLLKPGESHNIGTHFIRWFLREVFSSEKLDWGDEFSLDSIDLNGIQVYREWKNIDILLSHSDFVIAIENKVQSSEHSRQLMKYSERVHKSFPNLNKAFVFLTIEGISPQNEQDAEKYIPIGYESIKNIIQIILSVYSKSLSNRIKYYIEDYLQILNRYIMKEQDKSVSLAQELYKNHREAIDFIIEFKPDRISRIRKLIEDTIENEGYVLMTCHKYYARFLTNELIPAIPNTGIAGWSGNEGFLFEVAYWEKGLSLKFVISPGNEENREVLSELMQSLPNSRNAKGKKFLTHYSDARKVNFMNDKFESDGEVVRLVKSLLSDNKETILLAEKKIIENRSRLIY